MAPIESGQRARRRTWLAVLAAVALLAIAPLASADEIVKLKAELAGANEVPPSGSPGSGHADVTYDKTTRTLTWTITYSGLESQVIMVHFHGPALPPITRLPSRSGSHRAWRCKARCTTG